MSGLAAPDEKHPTTTSEASYAEAVGSNVDYPCPCCGYLVFTEPPGSFEICPICFWEDDVSQLAIPHDARRRKQAMLVGSPAQLSCLRRSGAARCAVHSASVLSGSSGGFLAPSRSDGR